MSLLGLSNRCHGYGTLTCHCGGDLCVCGLDGVECLGCPDCEPNDEEDDDDDFNPDACPVCGSNEGNAPICSMCGHILLGDDD